MRVILKNLADPIKSQNRKYRTLKLSNPKLIDTLWSIPYIRMEWFEQTLGFTTQMEDNEEVLILTQLPSSSPVLLSSIYHPLQTSLDTALQLVDKESPKTTADLTEGANKKLKQEQDSTMTESQQQQQPQPLVETLSEKQKARRLLEQSKAMEQKRAKEERMKQLQLLQQDQHTRMNDPNWKPGLSAACAKSGTSISTFRDKYGEN